VELHPGEIDSQNLGLDYQRIQNIIAQGQADFQPTEQSMKEGAALIRAGQAGTAEGYGPSPEEQAGMAEQRGTSDDLNNQYMEAMIQNLKSQAAKMGLTTSDAQLMQLLKQNMVGVDMTNREAGEKVSLATLESLRQLQRVKQESEAQGIR
jgi:hypothetical protein